MTASKSRGRGYDFMVAWLHGLVAEASNKCLQNVALPTQLSTPAVHELGSRKNDPKSTVEH